jgi:ribose-phosphate pyrophosphokinase
MELVPRKRLELFSGRAHPELAREVADHLQIQLGELTLREFSDGEIYSRFDQSVRGKDIFLLQTHAGPVNDSIFEQLIMVDAAKRASAKRITAVCPYYGYSRQDRKASGREPITAKLVADLFKAAGADRIISVDLHSGQIQGFFDGPVDHLTATQVLTDYLRAQNADDLVIVAPDAGRVKVAERYAQKLQAGLAVVHKSRPKNMANVVNALNVVGDVADKRCVIVDDMIDTAGTVTAAADLLLDRGASDVWVMATHPILSGPAMKRLADSSISRVIVTNTLPLTGDRLIDKVEVVSIAKVIADAIAAVFEDGSVSELFHGDNLS